MTPFNSAQLDSCRHVHADPKAATKYWIMNELYQFGRDQLHLRLYLLAPQDAAHAVGFLHLDGGTAGHRAESDDQSLTGERMQRSGAHEGRARAPPPR